MEAARIKAVMQADLDYIVDLSRRMRHGHVKSAELSEILSVMIDVCEAWSLDGSFPAQVERALVRWRTTRSPRTSEEG